MCWKWGFPGGSVVKNLPANAGDVGLSPGLRRSPGERNANLLQYSCLENSTDRGAWWVAVHGVPRSGRNLATEQQRIILMYLNLKTGIYSFYQSDKGGKKRLT